MGNLDVGLGNYSMFFSLEKWELFYVVLTMAMDFFNRIDLKSIIIVGV